MDLNTISKRGWYLFRITGYFSGFEQMVVTDFESMNKYKLKPGAYVTIHNLKCSDKPRMFLLMPYIKDYGKNYEYLRGLSNLIKDFEEINKKGINNVLFSRTYKYCIKKIKTSFKRNNFKGLRLTEVIDASVLELLIPEASYEEGRLTEEIIDEPGKLAVPESFFNHYCTDFGELVLLRNDSPPPKIF